MKVLKTLGNISFVLLVIVSLFVDCMFVYYKYIDTDVTIGVNYIDNQLGIDIKNTEDMTQEEINNFENRYFLTANYYDNSNENGIELQELRFDYFTDYTLTSDKYRSTGMQYIGDYKFNITNVNSREEANKWVSPDFVYYDTTNGVTWSSEKLNTQLNRENQFIIKIDNKPYAICLDKTIEVYERFLFWDIHTGTYYMTYAELFENIFTILKTNSLGYGDYYVTVDLSEFFTIKAYDVETGKYSTDDVTDIIKNYSVLKFHYEANGAKQASQSLFGRINGDATYDTTIDVNTDYWQERVVYTLGIEDLSLRYSNIYDAYFVSLNVDTKNTFANMPRSKVNILIDLNLVEYEIAGLDYNAFENFVINELSIIGDSQTFYMLDKSLYDTNLQTLKYSNGITFDFSSTATNNDFVEVVV